MATISRWDRVIKGMTLEEAKSIFGKDIWQSPGFSSCDWLVNNERDSNPDHGYLITFSKNGKVKSKGTFSIAG